MCEGAAADASVCSPGILELICTHSHSPLSHTYIYIRLTHTHTRTHTRQAEMERLHERDLNTSRRREADERVDQIEHSQRQERQFDDLASDRIRSAEEAMEARYASRMETLTRGEKVRERRATDSTRTLYTLHNIQYTQNNLVSIEICTLRNNF